MIQYIVIAFLVGVIIGAGGLALMVELSAGKNDTGNEFEGEEVER